MGSRESVKQEKDEGSREIFDTIKGLYSRRGYLGKKGKSEECGRTDRRI